MLIHFFNNALNITIQYFWGSTIFKPNSLNLIVMIIGVIIYIAILAYFFLSNFKKETNKESLETIKENNNSKKTFNIKNILNRDNLAFYLPILFMIFIYIIIV